MIADHHFPDRRGDRSHGDAHGDDVVWISHGQSDLRVLIQSPSLAGYLVITVEMWEERELMHGGDAYHHAWCFWEEAATIRRDVVKWVVKFIVWEVQWRYARCQICALCCDEIEVRVG